MATFDSVLNDIIPWAVAIIGLYILYRPLKEPLSPFFIGIGNFFGAIKRKITGEDKLEEGSGPVQSLEYE